jgi:hypothetical protein
VAVLRGSQEAVTGKPTVSELGIDLAAQTWQRSGPRHGGIEVAFVRARDAHRPDPPHAHRPDPPHAHRPDPPHAHRPDPPAPQPARPPARTEWVLLRVTGDPDRRVLVFDRHEWECFLDGARHGEFDDAATREDDAATRKTTRPARG